MYSNDYAQNELPERAPRTREKILSDITIAKYAVEISEETLARGTLAFGGPLTERDIRSLRMRIEELAVKLYHYDHELRAF